MEHSPEKWIPVFRQENATNQKGRAGAQSTLILASLMIFSYFAISSRIYLPNASPCDPIGSKPSVFSRSFISGNASTLPTAACSLAEISAGRFFGPHNPYHETNSNPFMPDSSTVGISGAAGGGLGVGG